MMQIGQIYKHSNAALQLYYCHTIMGQEFARRGNQHYLFIGFMNNEIYKNKNGPFSVAEWYCFETNEKLYNFWTREISVKDFYVQVTRE